jgi:hypothetical protein
MTGSQVVALDCAIVVLMNLLPLRLGRECEMHPPFLRSVRFRRRRGGGLTYKSHITQCHVTVSRHVSFRGRGWDPRGERTVHRRS